MVGLITAQKSKAAGATSANSGKKREIQQGLPIEAMSLARVGDGEWIGRE